MAKKRLDSVDTKPKKIKLYSITVSGQGDTFITLVTKEIWDWVQSPLGVPVPQDVIDNYYEDNSDEDKEDSEHRWMPDISNTKGEPNGCTVNDAALAAPGAKIDGKRASFLGMREFTKFIHKYSVEIVDEWEGYIY